MFGTPGRKRRLLVCTVVVLAILVIAVIYDLTWATYRISFGDVVDVIMGNGTWANNILVKDNAQRVAIGALVGSGLAACGCVTQAVFRNPMASPYILGLSSGASLGAAIGLIFTIPFIPMAVATPLLAFITCLATMFLVYGVAHVGGSTHTETLLLTGIAISSMMSAVVSHINEMSGGERQRVIIARALAQTPRYLLMDEPTNHLDVNMQFEVLDLVHRLSREKGLTVVIVSHDLPMASRYCDRIAMIHDHRVMCCGTPEEVLTPENMKAVFNVDAELSVDSKTGKHTVLLHGVAH